MSYQEIAVLSENLIASSKGKPIDTPYQAVLVQNDSDGQHYIVQIKQYLRGEWHMIGTWRLSTLLFSFPANLGNKPNDGLSLDFGQQWQIDAGMLDALKNAVELI